MTTFKNISPIPIIELTEEFLTAKKSSQLYYKTDSHWSAFGANFAYQILMKKTQSRFSSIRIVSLDDFAIEWKKVKMDIATLLDLNIYEKKAFLGSKFELITKEKRTERIIKLSCPSANNDLKLLMFRDSYGRELIPFMASSFSNSTFIWNYKIDHETFKEEKPDVLVIEVVERSLERLRMIQ